MTVVQRRPQAVEDIAEGWDHIADDSLRAADRWVDQLDEDGIDVVRLLHSARDVDAVFGDAGT